MGKKNKKFSFLKKIFAKKNFKFCLKWGFIFFIWFAVFLIAIIAYYSRDLPDLKSLFGMPKEVNIEVLYNDKKIIKKYGNLNLNINNYAEFPLYLIDGLIATEDRKFFKHGGFDYFGILRAAFVNLKYGYIKQGGSTITQQLSKMILQNNKKTLKRKIQELLLAIVIENKMTKEDILKMYLNTAYFGAGKYGIFNASQFYFNKSVSSLNLEESAMLIGLLKAPSKYSPQNNPVLSKKRTKQIIENMNNAGLLSKEEYNEYLINYLTSINESVFNLTENLNQELYFSDWIRAQITDYTKENNLEVITTLNFNIQTAIEKSIYKFTKENSKKLKNSQISVIAMSKNGAILGMAGGINYNKSEFNRAIYSYRQAGSIFKLFVFLAGIRAKNFTPNTMFVDEPVAVGNWFPNNYGEKYYGNVTMETAFAKSLNSVAIQIAEYSKLSNVANMAKKMGILSFIDKDDPTITLGTPQVSLLELTSTFSVIINEGKAVIPYSIIEIKNKDTNNIIYQRDFNISSQILNKKEIEYIQQMLYSVVVNGTGKNAQIPFLIAKGQCCIGGKTGTTQNYSDAWFIGYANNIVLGIWIGNDDNTSMGKTTGGTLPSILWKDIVLRLDTRY